jgi:Secretory lipase
MPVVVRRVLAGLLALALATVTAVVWSPTGVSPAGAQTDFYTPPSPLPAGDPGDVIKSQPFNYAGAGWAAQVMYLSRNSRNQPMAVTGSVLVPSTPWNGPGPQPVVAYAPFTAGLGDQCALSKVLAGQPGDWLVSDVQKNFVNNMLSRGIVVAQTDYEGLGTPGDHTYVMRATQAHAVLDVVRAAKRLPQSVVANSPVGIAGYSQGGGASAAAAELAPTYAPELNIVGAYAGAPVGDLAAVGRALDGSMYAAFLGYALVGIQTQYPDAGIVNLANDRGVQLFTQIRTQCTLQSVFGYMFTQSNTLTRDGRPVTAYMTEPPFNTIVAENRVGTLRPTAPVLMEASWIDDVLPPAQGKQVGKDWCSQGANVQWRDLATVVPLFTHLLEGNTSAVNAANWLNGRFRGTAPTPNCGAF